jgi:hypothetical protein
MRLSRVHDKKHRLGKARYLELQRNQARFMLAAIAYNIKRGAAVQAEMTAMAG